MEKNKSGPSGKPIKQLSTGMPFVRKGNHLSIWICVYKKFVMRNNSGNKFR